MEFAPLAYVVDGEKLPWPSPKNMAIELDCVPGRSNGQVVSKFEAKSESVYRLASTPDFGCDPLVP